MLLKNASGEPRMYETTTCLEQSVVVHPNILFQGFEARVERCASGGLRTESHDLCRDTGIVDSVDVSIHELFQSGLGVKHVEMVIPYEFVVA